MPPLTRRQKGLVVPTAILVPALLWIAHLAWWTYTTTQLHDWILKYHGLDKITAEP